MENNKQKEFANVLCIKNIKEKNKSYEFYEVEELQAIYDGCASFYKKAKVVKNYSGGELVGVELYSYGTKVAEGCWFSNGLKAVVWYGYNSITTRRHLKEYLKQFFGGIKLDDFEAAGGNWLAVDNSESFNIYNMKEEE